MRIDKNTVWFVASCKAPNIISYSDDTPDYIKDWFKEHRPNLILSDGEDKKELIIPVSMERWPTPDELQDDVLYFYFNNTNYRNTDKFVDGNKGWVLSETVKFPCAYIDIPDDVDNVGFHSVIQFYTGDAGNYRRHKLRKYLNANFDYVYVNESEIGECDTLIISKPFKWKIALKNIKYKRLIYDRSDYWYAHGVEDEYDLIKKADVVINSTDFLYNDSLKYNDNCQLVYNGSTVRIYKKLPKIDKYVYIGRSEKKIDWEWMNSLGLPVDVYGEISGYDKKYDNITMMGYKTEKELAEILSQYRAGLVAFNDDEFNKGMLPIKIFNYLDAGLEIITHNCPEADNYLKYHKDEPHDWWDRFSKFPLEPPEFHLIRRDEDTMSVWWSMSRACNFNCPYCCQTSKANDNINNDEAIKVSKHLHKLFKESGFKKIKLSILGGEPALFDLPTILHNMNDEAYKFEVSILTNFSLKDADWWNSIDVRSTIVASFHVSQLKDVDGWIEKAKKMKHTFRAKFVITDDNLEQVKQMEAKCVENGLEVELEGARDYNHHPMFGKEVLDYIKSKYQPNMIAYRGNKYNQTELIMKVHQDAPNTVLCRKRLAIRGNTIQSGCKYVTENKSIYDLEKLDWEEIVCDKIKSCNLCMLGEVKAL